MLVHSASYTHRERRHMPTITNKKDYNVKDYKCVRQDIA